jgi:transcriptional regulator with XRE-family HTH domain
MSTFNPNQEAHYQILREMLVQARQARGLYQKDVAERLGKDQTFVSKYEIGERKLDWVEVLSLIELLDISVEAFLQEYQARVIKFNELTETHLLQDVATREKWTKARQEIRRIMREYNMTYMDLDLGDPHPSPRETKK